MKRVMLFIGMFLLALGLMSQSKKTYMLGDQHVVPPKFVVEEVEKPASNTSPICCYIQENLPLDKRIKGNATEGTVAIEFTVNADGTLSDFIVANKVSYELDRSVIDCIKESEGMWKPGEVNGRPSAMEKRVYVRFDDPDNVSFETIARSRYFAAIKRFQKGQNIENNNLLEKHKQERKAQRLYKNAIAQLNDATVYLPNDPSLAFWKAKNYEQLGMFKEMTEMMELRSHLLSMRLDERKLQEYYDLAVIYLK